MTIQSHHLHTHGPDPMRPAVKPNKAQWKPEVHRFDLDDEETWPQVERDGEYVLVYFGTDSLLEHGEYPYEIKRAAAVPYHSGVVAWVRMTEFFKAIEKEIGEK